MRKRHCECSSAHCAGSVFFCGRAGGEGRGRGCRLSLPWLTAPPSLAHGVWGGARQTGRGCGVRARGACRRACRHSSDALPQVERAGTGPNTRSASARKTRAHRIVRPAPGVWRGGILQELIPSGRVFAGLLRLGIARLLLSLYLDSEVGWRHVGLSDHHDAASHPKLRSDRSLETE